mmetsp:Transcript_11437/g.35241  ORF Transcript_11437/g.35241 Transcript_11437/m.35241 type:complete len:281 (-) Transcript_11437:182-1024(-)
MDVNENAAPRSASAAARAAASSGREDASPPSMPLSRVSSASSARTHASTSRRQSSFCSSERKWSPSTLWTKTSREMRGFARRATATTSARRAHSAYGSASASTTYTKTTHRPKTACGVSAWPWCESSERSQPPGMSKIAKCSRSEFATNRSVGVAVDATNSVSCGDILPKTTRSIDVLPLLREPMSTMRGADCTRSSSLEASLGQRSTLAYILARADRGGGRGRVAATARSRGGGAGSRYGSSPAVAPLLTLSALRFSPAQSRGAGIVRDLLAATSLVRV